MIDTHAHLDFENFDQDREEVVSRAFDNGVKKIINIGVDLKTSKRSIEIAEGHENIFAAVGLHPDFFNKVKKEFSISNFQFSNNSEINKLINELKKLAKNKKVFAIGETGLDYFSHTGQIITDKKKENQKKGFLAHIEIARELDLPVIVHCRNAWRDLYEIISEFSQSSALKSKSRFCLPQAELSEFLKAGLFENSSKPIFSKFVLHCYSGEKEDTEKFLELDNVLFSFSGNITYPKPIERAEKLAEAVQMIPLDKIMLDSDCPFLAPQTMRGKRNEPMFVRYIAEKIAQIKKISVEEAERETDKNAEKFFGIG